MPQSLPLRLSLFYAAVFSALGVMLPFIPVWMKSRGLSELELGMVFALGLWVRIGAGPLIGRLADRLGTRQRVLAVTTLASAISFAALLPAYGFWPVLVLIAIGNVFYAPVIALGDALTIHHAQRRGLDYGRIRLWGSLTFIAAATGTGWLLTGRGPDLIMWLIVGFMGATFLCTLWMPDVEPDPGRNPGSLSFLALLRHPVFLLMMGAGALIQGSHNLLYLFGTLHWQAAGHPDVAIGLLWATGVIAEVVLFAYGNRVVARLGPGRLLLLAAAAGIVRWTVTGATDALPVLFTVQTLHAATFGCTHLAAVHFIGRAVPQEFAATAQSLYASVAIGGFSGIMALMSGYLYAGLGGSAFFVMALLTLASAVLGLALMRRWDGKELDFGPAVRSAA